jgi:hypothetical protein
MGRAKEAYMEQQQQQERDERIAELLGITYEELCEADWHIEDDTNRDGMRLGYIVYFEESTPKYILENIADLDENNQVQLGPNAFAPDSVWEENFIDFAEFDAIIANKFFYDSFQKEIKNARLLNELEIDAELLSVLKRQLYITAIGTLETFLSETFINLTNGSDEYFKNFIESYPKFKERKFQLNEIYKEYDNLRETAKKEMLEVIYHNLAKVENMFKSTFKIEFPDITELSKAVVIRHDLVHRNGKSKDEVDVVIEKETVSELLTQISDFVDDISISLNIKGEFPRF